MTLIIRDKVGAKLNGANKTKNFSYTSKITFHNVP
jgi:hypothetical protein